MGRNVDAARLPVSKRIPEARRQQPGILRVHPSATPITQRRTTMCRYGALPTSCAPPARSNILLDANGRAKISDFGLARCKYSAYLDTNRPETGSMAYMAPECWDPSGVGGLSDKMDLYRCARAPGSSCCRIASHAVTSMAYE